MSREKITNTDKSWAGAIGARIRLMRGQERQKDFAKRTGLSPQHLSNYEHGHRTPALKQLAGLADLNGVSLHWLITGEGPMLAEGLRPRVAEEQAGYNQRRRREDREKIAETTVMEAVQTIIRSNNRLVIQALKTNLEVFLQALGRR